MDRENRKKSYEKGYYKRHPCKDAFVCKVGGRTVVSAGAGSEHRNHCPYCLASRHLDIEPGEILKQLFKTRRDLQKQEIRAEGLEEQVRGLVERNSALYAQCEAFAMQVAELKTFCQQHMALSEKMTGLLDRMHASLAAGAAAGKMMKEEGAAEPDEASAEA